MKPDDFMNVLKANPRPEFEADLRRRLAQLERKKHLMLTIKRSTGLAAAFIALTFVTLLIAAPDVLAQMGDELERIAGLRIERAENQEDVPIPDYGSEDFYYFDEGLTIEAAAEEHGFEFPDMSEYGLEWIQNEVFIMPGLNGATCYMLSGEAQLSAAPSTEQYKTVRVSVTPTLEGCVATDDPSLRAGEETVLTEVQFDEFSGVYIPEVWTCMHRQGDTTMDCFFEDSRIMLILFTDAFNFTFVRDAVSVEDMMTWMGGEIVEIHIPTAVPTEE